MSILIQYNNILIFYLDKSVTQVIRSLKQAHVHSQHPIYMQDTAHDITLNTMLETLQ